MARRAYDPGITKDLEKIQALLQARKKIDVRIGGLKERIQIRAKQLIYKQLQSKPIDWNRLALPMESCPLRGDRIHCVVCNVEEVTTERYLSGCQSFLGFEVVKADPGDRGEIVHTDVLVHVHAKCVPPWVLERRSWD